MEITSKVVETTTQSDNILVDLESMPDLSGSGEGKWSFKKFREKPTLESTTDETTQNTEARVSTMN